MTGSVHTFYIVVVCCPAGHLGIDIGRGDHVGKKSETPVGQAAINVVAHNRRVRLGGRRTPLQQNAVRLLIVRYPAEHHADDPEKKDRHDRSRQA